MPLVSTYVSTEISSDTWGGLMTGRPKSPSHERLRAEAARLGFELVSMPLVFELPDGGRVEVTDAAIVPMGDVFAHRQLTYSRPSEGDRPACRIVFERKSFEVDKSPRASRRCLRTRWRVGAESGWRR
jgi:hypothetical protein